VEHRNEAAVIDRREALEEKEKVAVMKGVRGVGRT